MANPSRSLSCRITWTAVLPALGVEIPRVIVLPQTVRCPVCDCEKLTVLDDPTLGGAWVSCRACNFSGDLVELVAAVWDVKTESAAARLDDLGLFADPVSDDDISAYMRDHVAYRRRIGVFWESARRSPMKQTSPSMRHLLRQFGLLQTTNSPMWPDRAGRFIGAAKKQEVEELFAPLSHDLQHRANRNGAKTKRRGGGPGGRRLFRGHGWEDVLVVPYEDLPGRICGFLFIGREANPEAGDFVYKRANFGCSSRRVREAGVAMLSSLHDGPDRQFGDVVFVIADPVVGLLLQTQKLRDWNRALPIVLGHFSQDNQTLRLPPELADRKMIFWGEHPQLLLHAKRHNGLVSCYKISHREVARRLNHRQPADWLRLIQEHAVPWVVAFRKQFRQLDQSSAAGLVNRMEFTPAEMRELIKGIGSDLQERLKECDPHRVGAQRVIVSGKTIVETKSGWEIDGTGEQLCNRPIRIEQVVTTADGDCFYSGTVSGGDGDHRFTLSKSDVDRHGLFDSLQDFLLNQNADILNFQPRWSRRAAYIAMQLHPPEFVTGAGRMGWRPNERCFQFPHFSIAYGGDVKRDQPVLLTSDDMPALHLQPPKEFYRRSIAALSTKSPETTIIWAMMACAVHNIIAAATWRDPCGIILDGEGTVAAGRAAARSLGCAEVDLRKRRRGQAPLEQISEAGCSHDWPTIVRLSDRARLGITPEWLDDPGVHNAILSLDGYGAVATASHPGFFRIHLAEPTSPLGGLRRATRSLIPTWLQDACRRNLWVDQVAEHEVFNLLHDIAKWFRQIGGDPRAVRAARDILSVDSLSPWSSFVRVIVRMHELGQITATRKGFDSSKRRIPVVVYDDSRAAVWVPARAINQILVERRVPALNLSTIQRSLLEENAWVEEQVYGGVNGWLLDQLWWDSKVDNLRRFDRIDGQVGASESERMFV